MQKIFTVLFLISSYCYSQPGYMSIHASITGLADTVFITRYPLSDFRKSTTDTIIASAGEFNYRAMLESPGMLLLLPKNAFIQRADGSLYMPPGRYMELFVSPNEQVQLSGHLEPYYLDYAVTGSPLSAANARFRESYRLLDIETALIELTIDSLSKTTDDPKAIDPLYAERKKRSAAITAMQTEFIQAHPDSEISAWYLSKFSHTEFARYYPLLTETVRTGFFKDLLDRRNEAYQKSQVVKSNQQKTSSGEMAANITVKDIYEHDFTLSALKGKVIILDFWGTWCGPCIKEIPALKALTTRLQDKVHLVGIACKDKKEDVLKAIAKYGISWNQLLNADSPDLSLLYGIKAYPTKIIIDKDMRIAGRFVGLDDDFYKLLDELTK